MAKHVLRVRKHLLERRRAAAQLREVRLRRLRAGGREVRAGEWPRRLIARLARPPATRRQGSRSTLGRASRSAAARGARPRCCSRRSQGVDTSLRSISDACADSPGTAAKTKSSGPIAMSASSSGSSASELPCASRSSATHPTSRGSGSSEAAQRSRSGSSCERRPAPAAVLHALPDVDPEEQGHAVGYRQPGARRLGHFELRRRGVAARERIEARRGARGAPRGRLVHALGEQGVAQPVGQRGEPRELGFERVCLRGAGVRQAVAAGLDRACLPAAHELQSVDDVGGRHCLHRLPVARCQLSRHEGRERAHRRDARIEVDALVSLVQRALEAIAEQGAERLSCAYAVDEPLRVAYPLRAQVDGHGVAAAGGCVRQEAAAQHCRGGG